MFTGLDHFIVLVNDLNAAVETFRSIGFDVRAGGEHPAFGSHNALVAFADGSYLELLAFKDPALAASTFWGDGVRKLKVGEGFGAFVLSSNDLAKDVQNIRQRGLEITDPQPGSRMRPEGKQVAWHTAMVGGTRTGILPFLIQDDTLRELRVEAARTALGSQVRPKEVVVAVKNIEVARQAYRELMDTEPRYVQNTAGDLTGYRVSATWGSIILAHSERKGNAMADQLEKRGEGLYALTLAADDMNRARSQVTEHKIPVEDDAGGFIIAPSAARGARLRIAQI